MNYILQRMAGALGEVELVCKIIDVWIHNLDNRFRYIKWTHSASINVRICPQWLENNVSPSLHCGSNSEVEFLKDVCRTTEDDFVFATEDFVKPTTEEGSSLTVCYTTQKRHLSQSYLEKQKDWGASTKGKEDYFNGLNRPKEKTIHSNFPSVRPWAQFGWGHGGRVPPLFQVGVYNMPYPPSFSLQVLYLEKFQKWVTFATFSVKCFSC